MLKRTYLGIAVVFVALANFGSLHADEAGSKQWMKYLAGEWTFKISDGTEGEGKFSFRVKRRAMIGVFKKTGSTSIEIGGWRPDKQVTMVNGFASNGDYWHLEYEKLSGQGGSGTIQGAVDGVQYKADFVATVVSHENWKWTISGKSPEGDDVKLSAEWSRKSK